MAAIRFEARHVQRRFAAGGMSGIILIDQRYQRPCITADHRWPARRFASR